jgi:hypothetical protein
MGKTVTLKHFRFRDPKRIVYFYDGFAVAENGLLELPAEKEVWIKRAFNLLGYKFTPDGRQMHSIHDLQAEVQRQTA